MVIPEEIYAADGVLIKHMRTAEDLIARASTTSLALAEETKLARAQT